MLRCCWVSFHCRGVLLIWRKVGQGPSALAVCAGGGCDEISSFVYHFSSLSPTLWKTALYRLKYMPQRTVRDGAMVLGKLPVPGRPTILMREGQGPTALAVGAGGVVWPFLYARLKNGRIMLYPSASVRPFVRPSVNFFVSE